MAIAALTWPALDYHIGSSLDDSAIAALHVASHRGLQFGSQIVSVYGPLGFLTVPRLAFLTQGILSFAYAALVVWSAALTMLWAARRSMALWAALPVAAVGVGILTTTKHYDVLTAAVVAAVGVWALAALDPGRPRWIGARAFPLVGGASGGLVYLVRPSAGLVIVVVFAIACAAAFPSRRVLAVATCLAGFVVAVLVLGLADRQSPESLLDYGSTSVNVMLNYAEISADERGPGSDYLLAGLALLVVIALAWRGTVRWPFASRAAAFAVLAVIMFAGFKQSFMRHDLTHVSYYFACALGLGFGSAALRRGRIGPLAGLMALMAMSFVATGLGQAFEARRSLGGLGDALTMLAGPNATIAAERRALRRKEALDAQALHAVADRTVHMWPVQAAIAWAYPQLRWHPLPVFQPGMAFSSRLDGKNAHILASPGAPQRILRAREDLSAALSPAARLSLFCHYRQVRAGPRWQVLAHGADRCGTPHSIASVTAVTDRPVRVPRPPRPNELVLARFRGLEPSLAGQIQGFIFKGPRWTISLGQGARAKLAVSLAREPLLLAIPHAIDYPPPFRFAPNPERLVVGALDPIRGRLHRRLTVDFLAVPVR